MSKKPPSSLPPSGFKFIKWDEVPIHAVVFRHGRGNEPYRVVDPDGRLLQKLTSTSPEVVDDEQLLVEDGPPVLIVTRANGIQNLYTDVPLTVYKFDAAAHTLTVTRARGFDAIPGEAAVLLREELGVWPPLYGEWETKKSGKTENLVSFELTNRMTVSALSAEMIRTGRAFKIVPNRQPDPSYWTIVVSKNVYDWIWSLSNSAHASESISVREGDTT